jgi:hypothetical protein
MTILSARLGPAVPEGHGGDFTDATAEMPAVGTDPAPGNQPAARPLAGAPMTIREQTTAVLACAFRASVARMRDLSRREGGPLHALLSGKPPSVIEQCEYARSREWVPEGHNGGFADRLGVLYHVVLGRPGVAAGNTVSAIFARPLRLALVVFTIGVVVLVVAIA